MKWREIAVMMCAIAIMASCNNKRQESPDTENAAQTETLSVEDTTEIVSLETLYGKITETVEFPEMLIAKDNYISNYYGIDPAILEEYVFATASDVVHVDTVILAKVKDEKNIQTVKEALETYVEGQKKEMENYLPEAYQQIAKSEIHTAGSYIYLVISEHDSDVIALITKYIK